ncbi:MAG: c-type cytochrome, methanol metabolism-related [Dongiaceae bacterium]
MLMKFIRHVSLWLAALVIAGIDLPAMAQEEEKPYKIAEDGTIDWYSYSGFRRYHADCHVCHGPDGLGSSFGPALVESLKTLSYEDFLDVVTNGRKNVTTASENVMPSFGLNPNVMCFVDDIYAYLKARSDGVLPRGRPEKKAEKPAEAQERDTACLGG